MNRFIFLFFVVILLFLSTLSRVSAQVVINEVSPATDVEWIELYNTSSNSVSLKEYSVLFDANPVTTQKRQFCDEDSIPALGYKLIHITNHYLNNSGDTLILKIGDDTVDSISYGSGQAIKSPISNQSISRVPDGGSWVILDLATPLGDETSFLCPTLSPTPSPSPDPNIQPTSSPAPTRSPSPSPTPTRSPSPKPSPTKSPSPSARPSGLVLGSEDIKTPSSSPVVKEVSEDSSPVLAFTLVGAGVVLMGFSGYLAFKKQKETLPQNTI